MKILISGGTGFIGTNLIPELLKNKHQVTVVGRQVKKINDFFKGKVTPLSWDNLNQISPNEVDAVINLAGHNIAQTRWTENTKKMIMESRLNSTRKLVAWCLKAKNKKLHLYNASAIGIYGLQQSVNRLPPKITEATIITSRRQDNFLSAVGQCWENEAKPAVDANFAVTFMRFAVVLKRHEGILKKLELPFSLGLGSILGEGEQAFSWISIDDLVRGILFLLERPAITGAVNFSAPECISQRDFAKHLAKVMHRPLFLKIPGKMLKMLFGQMGDELLLSGQNVYPERLKQLGFEFLYPDIHSALLHEWQQLKI